MRSHSFMASTGKKKWVHKILTNFVNGCRWFWERVVWLCWTSIWMNHESWIKSFLNIFASQMLYCFLETCLICNPTMKRHEVQKNIMRFGSSSVCLCSYHHCFYTWGIWILRAYYLSILISLLKLFINWNSFHTRLNSHNKAWSYKKKKLKKIKSYNKSL